MTTFIGAISFDHPIRAMSTRYTYKTRKIQTRISWTTNAILETKKKIYMMDIEMFSGGTVPIS